MNKQIALKNIIDFTSCLQDKYFLVYGTALGALREQDIIAHDLDIDIGIMQEHFDYQMLNNIINKGFIINRIFGMQNCGFEMSFKRDNIKIDLIFFYNMGGLVWNCLWKNGGKNGFSDMIVHSYSTENFIVKKAFIGKDKFNSLGYNYIEAVYGKEWRTPVLSWDWKIDHFCVDNNLRYKIIEKYGK
jgi:fukutin